MTATNIKVLFYSKRKVNLALSHLLCKFSSRFLGCFIYLF